MPDKPFFAVLVGDMDVLPTHTEIHGDFIRFDEEEKFRSWIKHEEGRVFSKREYIALKCIPVKVTSTIDIKISLSGDEGSII